MTLVSAVAGFVIVFQFLALQLRAGKDPAIGGAAGSTPQASHVASTPTTGSASPVVTRASGGAQTAPASSTQASPTAAVTSSHPRTHHTVLTGASGSSGAGGGHPDDLD